MKLLALVLTIAAVASFESRACTPVTITDENGQPLKEEALIESEYRSSSFVFIGDVITSEIITEYEDQPNGRKRPHRYQKATIVVRKSWKSSKRDGETLEVYTDLDHTCNRWVPIGQALIYANGKEPVELSSVRISSLAFGSPDVATLDRVATIEQLPPAPNKPFQRTRLKQRASER